jgi:hypothetical protein
MVTYEEAIHFVRTYSVGVPPYDVNGVVHLMLAAIDNLSQHWIESDLEQIGDSATEQQCQRLIEIGRFLETFVPEDD